MARRLDAGGAGFEAALTEFLAARAEIPPEIDAVVGQILGELRDHGDAALICHIRCHEGWEPAAESLFVTPAEIDAAIAGVEPAIRDALELAATRIRDYHQRQLPEDIEWRDESGVTLGWRWRPVRRAGLYAPGGRAPYPSSVLMGAIPARVAGVGEIMLATPSAAGQVDPVLLLAARLAGVDTVLRAGGAQAIGAMAYGTATVPRVDVIAGPGNAYVAAAKRRVFGQVGIDALAGPSDVAILADGGSNPEWVALDLLAQAEHDPLAQSILITDDSGFADAVETAIATTLDQWPASGVARESWSARGAVILVESLARGVSLADRIAPEHLQICARGALALAATVRNAGAVFIGAATPEAFGDYLAGPNHVLPTGGTARFASGLSVLSFMKRTSIVGAGDIGPATELLAAAEVLAEAEGFEAHRRSLAIRRTGRGARRT